ncbi:hypothetical protein GWK47_016295 [Chionoecetes opilio]|uniref:Uncharacterized protein n=1 Tax=Chionoecetes opilio TaxID=41210 RepID=A0A8J4XTI4_CHIOP|nr:hypothetical protein GWK47_016295 [Chionoecetes opilio]
MENPASSIMEEFVNHGHWVIRKTANKFSAIPIDHAHEHNNELMKGSGGAVGLTENPSAFRKWVLAGPEQARLLTEFEDCSSMENEDHSHHEQARSTQESFKKQVVKLTNTMREMGNPFLNNTEELLTLDSHDVLNQSVVNTVRTIETLGKQQFSDYCKLVLDDCERSIHDPMKKNSLPLFKSPVRKSRGKQADKIEGLKTDVSIFSRLYIVAQHRDCDMNSFFSHENNSFPPSVSDKGKLRLGSKSDLLKCLIKKVENDAPNLLHRDDTDDDAEMNVLELGPELMTSLEEPVEADLPSTFDVKVLNGAAVVHLLQPFGVKTFEDYANDIFIPYIIQQLSNTRRVDIIWDRYAKDSIKSSARQNRGKVDVQCENFVILERFAVLLYQRTSQLESVHEARRVMFASKTRQWKLSHQHSLLFLNTQSVLCTKQESGPHVTYLSRKYLLQRIGGGKWTQTASVGPHSGQHFPLHLRHVENVLSVVVRLRLAAQVAGLPALTQVRQDNAARIKWDFRDMRKREEYGHVVTELLRGIAINPVRVCCFQNACLDRGHHDDINAFQEALIECMLRAGQTVFGFCRKRWRQVPGWNEFVREAHSAARESFLEWRAGGGPRGGPLAERMRSTRARFKLCLRWCKSHEHQLRAQSLADKLASGDSFNFWRGVRSMNPGSQQRFMKP